MQAPPALSSGTQPTVAAKPKQGYVAMEGIGPAPRARGIFANVKLTAPPPAPGQKSSGLSFPKPAGGNPFASFISAPAPAPTAPSSAFGGGSSFLASPTSSLQTDGRDARRDQVECGQDGGLQPGLPQVG